jgi:hypothetical protein
MSNGSSRWRLDLGLVRRGKARVLSPLSRGYEDVSWTVSSLPTGLLPISVVECRMRGLGGEAEGYGDSLTYSDSLTQAFAEAWERLWFDACGAAATDDPAFDSSSGFAGGPTPDDARAAAREELVERAVLLTAWRARAGWERVEPEGLLSRVLETALNSLGWDVRCFRLREERLGEVFCALGTRPQGGVLFDSAFRAPGRGGDAVQAKVLRSLLRTAAVFRNAPPSFEPLPDEGGPQSHRRFYAVPENQAAFDFLAAGGTPGPIALGGYDDVRTSVLADIAGFPCVARATHPSWPRLTWGRKSVSEGANEWPHPLV